ncbi:MAG: glycosyltransferase [bacterium]
MNAVHLPTAPGAPTIWVILPAFNEAAGLPRLLEAIERVDADRIWRVIVVDDGSTDGTGAVAHAHAGRLALTVLDHGTNRGLAAATRTGFEHACKHAAADAVIVTMDADHTHDPAQIPPMVEAISHGADIVIASRYRAGARQAGVPPHRALLSAGVGWLLRLRFGLAGVRDYSCGFRAYRAAVLQRALAAYGERLIESRGFVVMTESLVKIAPFGPHIVEVPLHLRYDRKVGPSKMPAGKTIAGYLRLVATRQRHP